MSSDRTSVTLIFDQFVASVGPDVAVKEARKNCQLNVDLHVPQGWSFSIGSVDYRGYVSLDRGLVGTQKSLYYFQGDLTQVSADTVFEGPVSKDYVVRDSIPLNATVWSDCNKTLPLNINASVRIDNRKNSLGRGQLTTDSIDGKVKTVLSLQWKQCS